MANGSYVVGECVNPKCRLPQASGFSPYWGRQLPIRLDYDSPMNPEKERVASQILTAERERRPAWRRFAVRGTPSWFSGNELNLLTKPERDALFTQISSKHKSARFVLFLIAAANAPNIINGPHSESKRWFWIALGVAYVLLPLVASLLRRRVIRSVGRRSVRDSGDWPLRSRNEPIDGCTPAAE